MNLMTQQALKRLRRVAEHHEAAADPSRRSAAETRISLARAAIIAAAFAVLASAAFLVRPEAIGTVRVPEGIQKRPVNSTGRAAFPLADGKTCRELVFDRTRGDIVDSNTAPCDSIARKVDNEPAGGASNGFVWGGRR